MSGKSSRPRRYEKAEIMRLPNGRILDMGKVKALYRAGWTLENIALDVHIQDIELVKKILCDAGMM